MIRPDVQDDAMSDLSTTQFTALTPSTSGTMSSSPWPESYDIPPKPGCRYVIRIKDTDRAITLTRDGLRLQETNGRHSASNRWLCVEEGMYLGFYNEEARVFIGHDGNGKMQAKALVLRDWERLSPRHQLGGGYELLSPHWFYWKRIINAAENKTELIRTQYGQTLWVFEEC